MAIKRNPPDEWSAAAKGALKTLASRFPGLGEALGAYEEFERCRKEKTLAQFVEDVHDRLERAQPKLDGDWLGSEEGQVFVGKVIDAALDAQTADKRQLFANALLNGAIMNIPLATKTKFVDLLRSLSRLALDVLAELHSEFRSKVANHSESTVITPERVAEQLCSGSSELDPYAVISAIEELRSAGLFSYVTRWRRTADGAVSSSESYSAGNIAYTEFTTRFVEFITDPAP